MRWFLGPICVAIVVGCGDEDAPVTLEECGAGEAMAVIQNQPPSSDHDSVRGQLVTTAALESPHLTASTLVGQMTSKPGAA